MAKGSARRAKWKPLGSALTWALSAMFALFLSPDARCADLDSALAESGLDESERALIEDVIADARADGVPVEALLSRVHEGVSKNVPVSRLAAALRNDLDNLLTARDVILEIPGGDIILGESASWERAANLLRAGWSTGFLARFTEACVPRPEVFREASLLTIAVMDWGVDEALALELTAVTVRSDLEPDEYPAVASLLGEARRRRVETARAIDMIADALEDGRSLAQMRRMFSR